MARVLLITMTTIYSFTIIKLVLWATGPIKDIIWQIQFNKRLKKWRKEEEA